MHALWIILTCFAAMFAFGFLLAGILGCADFDQLERPVSREDQLLRLFDSVVLCSFGFLTAGVVKNWANRPQERRFVYAGLLSLAAGIVFGCVAVCTG